MNSTLLNLVIFLSCAVSAGKAMAEVSSAAEDVRTTPISYSEDLKLLVPRKHQYHQTLTMKLFMAQALFDGKLKHRDNGKSETFLTCEQALEVIRRMDNLTLGIPKIVYLVGWQYNGHDSKYPAWFEGNERLKRPQDANAMESLKWLMKEAEAYHTTVSLHINMFDAYEDSPLWDEYLEKDVIAKNVDGTPRACEWGYPISYAREWETGLAKRRIDALCELLPIQHAGTIHIDAFHTWPPVPGIDEHGKYHVEKAKGVISPYLKFTVADETEAQRNVLRYWAEKGVDVTSESVDFLRETAFEGYQPMAWWFNRGGLGYYLKWPASYYCGGRDNTEWGMLFGTSMHGEDIVRKDPESLRGFKEQFCLNAAVWYYLNRLQRLQVLDGKEYKSVRFSDGVRTELTRGEGRVWKNALYRISQGGVTLVENTDVLIPALWMGADAMIAYSRNGYENRSWTLPEAWKNVIEAKVCRITDEGRSESETRKLRDGKLELTLAKDEMLLIEKP
jgi:hypothetical protein